MTEKVLAALDAITSHVLTYRPIKKGLAAQKAKRRIERATKEGNQDDRESSI